MKVAGGRIFQLLAVFALFWAQTAAWAAEPPKDNSAPRYVSLQQKIEEDQKAIARLEHRLKRMKQHETVLSERASREESYNRIVLESHRLPNLRNQLAAQISAVQFVTKKIQVTSGFEIALNEAGSLLDTLMERIIEIDRILESKADSRIYIKQLEKAVSPLTHQVNEKMEWLTRMERMGPILEQFAQRFEISTSEELKALQGEVLEELVRLDVRFAPDLFVGPQAPLTQRRILCEYEKIFESSYAQFDRVISQIEKRKSVDLSIIRPSLIRYIALTEYLGLSTTREIPKPTVEVRFKPDLDEAKAFLAFPIQGLIPFSPWSISNNEPEVKSTRERLSYTLPILILPALGASITHFTHLDPDQSNIGLMALLMTRLPLMFHGAISGVYGILGLYSGTNAIIGEAGFALENYMELHSQKRAIQLIERLQTVLTLEVLCSALLK